MAFALEQLENELIIHSRGKNWKWRLPVLLWFLYVSIRYLTNPDYSCILSPLNLGIHELGHFIFSFFGRFLYTLGGTIFQVSVPVLAGFNFYRQKDFFAISLSLGWLSTNLFDIARYVADARAQILPLVSPFGESAIHDWNYMLDKLGLLPYDLVLASILRIAAVISMAICFLSGAWILWQMINWKDETEKLSL